jgi:hypothetical protein
MRVTLMAHGPAGVTDALVWSGEVPWPDVPIPGTGVRVPTDNIGGLALDVQRVIYEPDGSVYFIFEPVDDETSQNLRFVHDWRPWGT